MGREEWAGVKMGGGEWAEVKMGWEKAGRSEDGEGRSGQE